MQMPGVGRPRGEAEHPEGGEGKTAGFWGQKEGEFQLHHLSHEPTSTLTPH